jgi:glutaredoxin
MGEALGERLTSRNLETAPDAEVRGTNAAELVSRRRSEHSPSVLRLRLLVLTLLLAALVGCKRPPPTADVVVLPVVTDTSADLLLTWIDEKGEFHVEQKVADVPVGARDIVRVADPVKDPPKLDDVFVADLRNAGAGGAYPVRTMGRTEFEKVAVERRQKNGGVLTAKGAESAPPAAARPSVIIYGASWCGPCHQAAAYLKRRGIPFIEKDIEQDGGAAREMQAKLASAGMRGGSIPVIDVRGKMLIGFDERAMDRALGQAL